MVTIYIMNSFYEVVKYDLITDATCSHIMSREPAGSTEFKLVAMVLSAHFVVVVNLTCFDCNHHHALLSIIIVAYRTIPLGTAPNRLFLVRSKTKSHGVASTVGMFEPSEPRLWHPRLRSTTNFVYRRNAIVPFFTIDHTHCRQAAGRDWGWIAHNRQNRWIMWNLIALQPRVYMVPFTRVSRTHMAYNVLVQVGTVDGHSYDSQQEDTICDVRGPWQTIQSTFKPVCRWRWLVTLLSCSDAHIWLFSWWQ